MFKASKKWVMMMNDIHSCSYYCDRPACIKAQRDELRGKLFAMNGMFGDKETIDSFKARLADAIEDMPFGDTAASFAIFIRNFK